MEVNAVNKEPVGCRGPKGDWKSYKDVRIGVYAICADEPEEFIDRWLESMSGADAIYVLVTKKNNPNYDYLCKRAYEDAFKSKLTVQEEEIKPWRFDVARNRSLLMVNPNEVDALVCTDIDEILIEDFWDDYRKMVYEHPSFERIYYKYAWSHQADGSPSKCFWYDKTHQPTGWKWQFPVHEALQKLEWLETEGSFWLDENKVYLHHYPDQTKSRGSYLALLELRAKENPDDLGGVHYLAREYGFHDQHFEAINTAFSLYVRICRLQLKNPQSPDVEMLSSVCVMIGREFEQLGLREESSYWFSKSICYCGALREGFVRLAQRQVWNGKPDAAEETLRLMEENAVKTQDWREEPYCWRVWKINQIKADICMWRGKYEEAEVLMKEAEADIKDDSDKALAYHEGFYGDLEFLKEKLKKE